MNICDKNDWVLGRIEAGGTIRDKSNWIVGNVDDTTNRYWVYVATLLLLSLIRIRDFSR